MFRVRLGLGLGLGLGGELFPERPITCLELELTVITTTTERSISLFPVFPSRCQTRVCATGPGVMRETRLVYSTIVIEEHKATKSTVRLRKCPTRQNAISRQPMEIF